MTELVLTSRDIRLSIDSEAGARIKSLRVHGHELIGAGSDSPYGWGAFPMAPFAGRVRNGVLIWDGHTHHLADNRPPHAIHGTVATRPWRIVDRQTTAHADKAYALLRCDLGPDWPWPGHAELRYELTPMQLDIELSVHSQSAAMPAWLGIHPWFTRRLTGDDGNTVSAQLDLRAGGLLVRDDQGIATSRHAPLPPGAGNAAPLDDCVFGVQWPVRVVWPQLLTLEIRADCDYLVAFTGRDQALAVEPQSAPPDAAALRLEHTCLPGHPHKLRTQWHWLLD